MKKKLIPILILINYSVSYSQNFLNINHLLRYEDKYYKRFNMSPYTGIVFKLSSNTWSKTLEAEIVNGVLDGSYLEWYDYKRKKERGSYLNGKPHGLFLSWYYSGNQKSETHYVDGIPVGLDTNLDVCCSALGPGSGFAI